MADMSNKPDRFFLRFDASRSAPNFSKIFMEAGGQINSVATNWETDFAVTDSSFTTVVRFPKRGLAEVSIELPQGSIMPPVRVAIAGQTAAAATQPDTVAELMPIPNNIRLNVAKLTPAPVVLIPNNSRLNVASQRMCAAINGTLVTSVACEGTVFLYDILDGRKHVQLGMTYKTYLAHAETIGMSNVRVVCVNANGDETVCKPFFKNEDERVTKEIKQATQLVEVYVKCAFETRQALVYKPSPMLHKSVYSTVVGVDGRGYCLMHDIMKRESYLSLQAMEGLFEAAVASELCHDKNDISKFLSHTNTPGVSAAEEGRVVANATSLVVNTLMSYRADGRNVVVPNGSGFQPVENWNGPVPRSCLEANDCDGLALMAVALLRSVAGMQDSDFKDNNDTAKYPYLRAIRNVINPYYQVAISVIGATCSEANSATSKSTKIAGHAIVLMIPTLSFLRALEKTSDKKIGTKGLPLYSDETRSSVSNCRFAALFPASLINYLPSNERDELSSWEVAKKSFDHIEAFAIEGTTPASSVLYVPDPEKRTRVEKNASMDKRVFAMAAPNVFRSVKSLHVGGHRFGSTHVMYDALLEATLAPDNPLWTNAALRRLGAAASQYVLVAEPGNDSVTEAGMYGALEPANLHTSTLPP